MTEPTPAWSIILVDSVGLLPGLIRILTRSSWSHAAIAVGDGRIVEAEADGTRYGTEAGLAGCRHVAVNVGRWTVAERAAIVAAAEAMIGTPYGYLDLLALGWHVWTGRYPKRMVARVEAQKAAICSQVAAIAWAAVGYEWRAAPALISPADLGLLPGTVTIR